MGLPSIIPLIAGAIGTTLGSTIGETLLGTSGLMGTIASAVNETPFLTAGGTGGLLGGGVTQQGVARTLGGALGGIGGGLGGGVVARGLTPSQSDQLATAPTPLSIPASPRFQFGAVASRPGVVSTRRGGDFTEVLRRLGYA